MHFRRAWAPLLVAALIAVSMLAASTPVDAQSPCRHVRVRSPFSHQTVRGVVPVLGSASIDDFGFYKVEWAHVASPESWSAVSTTVAEPVVNGTLDRWDTTRIPDGTYRIKLTAVDSLGQEPCRAIVDRLTVANSTDITPTVTADLPAAVAVVAQSSTTPGADSADSEEGDDSQADAATPTRVDRLTTEDIDQPSDEGTDDAANENATDDSDEPGGVVGESNDDSTAAEDADRSESGAAGDDSQGIAPFEPSTWADSLGLSSLPLAFAGGALLTLAILLIGLAYYVLRGR